jgi:7-carboxy-7-deazaguanine synthase
VKVIEIFYSIQGESSYAGLPCVFIRFSGCNLRCRYCDSRYAYEGGMELTPAQIIEQIGQYDCRLVELTGGEPLLQLELSELINKLLANDYQVLVETNSSLDIGLLPTPVIRVIDIKCPGSNESHKMKWENLNHLRPTDEIKFVISHYNDFNWALDIVKKYNLLMKAPIHFSPAFGELKPSELAQWILEMKLPIRLHLQQHKFVGIK